MLSEGSYVKAQALLRMIVLTSRIRAMSKRSAPSLHRNFSDRTVMQVVCTRRGGTDAAIDTCGEP